MCLMKHMLDPLRVSDCPEEDEPTARLRQTGKRRKQKLMIPTAAGSRSPESIGWRGEAAATARCCHSGIKPTPEDGRM